MIVRFFPERNVYASLHIDSDHITIIAIMSNNVSTKVDLVPLFPDFFICFRLDWVLGSYGRNSLQIIQLCVYIRCKNILSILNRYLNYVLNIIILTSRRFTLSIKIIIFESKRFSNYIWVYRSNMMHVFDLLLKNVFSFDINRLQREIFVHTGGTEIPRSFIVVVVVETCRCFQGRCNDIVTYPV